MSIKEVLIAFQASVMSEVGSIRMSIKEVLIAFQASVMSEDNPRKNVMKLCSGVRPSNPPFLRKLVLQSGGSEIARPVGPLKCHC